MRKRPSVWEGRRGASCYSLMGFISCGLVERYDTAKARYDDVVVAISAKEAQNERLANFIKVLKA